MAEYRFTIPGRLDGLNEYIKTLGANRNAGAHIKSSNEVKVIWILLAQLRGVKCNSPVKLHYKFYEKDRKRDLDNVASFAMKVIQDALVSQKILHNDGQSYVVGFTHEFYIDEKEPRVEVRIEEVM